jgi:hypothetical protein
MSKYILRRKNKMKLFIVCWMLAAIVLGLGSITISMFFVTAEEDISAIITWIGSSTILLILVGGVSMVISSFRKLRDHTLKGL